MKPEDIISAVVAFLLGLLSKLVYDLWADRRKKQELTFYKRTVSSFSTSMLGDKLRDSTALLFSGERVQSIQLVSVEVENTGSRAVRNQAFTVRFDEKARILGMPKSLSTSEDMRFVQVEELSAQENAYRFNIQLLQKKHRLGWEMAVVDNTSGIINIEHGLATSISDLNEVDLDVSSVVTGSKAQLDALGRIRRMLVILVGIFAVAVIRDTLTSMVTPAVTAVLNAAIIIMLLVFLQNVLRLIPSITDALRSTALGGTQADVSLRDATVSAGGNFIGRDYVVANYLYDTSISNALSKRLERVYEQIEHVPDYQEFDVVELRRLVERIEGELKKGDQAKPEKVSAWLEILAQESPEIYQALIAQLNELRHLLSPAVQLSLPKPES